MRMMLEELYQPIAPQIGQVREIVNSLWTEALALVHGPSIELPKGGGKLLRPALCLLTAGAAGAEDVADYVDLAAGCELLHMAALTHDDIVDKAALRRGATSLNALWGDRTAVLSGDYLVARATRLFTNTGSCDLIASIFKSVQQMTEGELNSIGRNGNSVTQKDCLRLAEQKTATYFAATCTSPTYLVGAQWREPLHQFGLAFGIAFQLIDDILDLCQDESILGKPSCGDIAEGKKTLPVLFMQETLSPAEVSHLQHLMGHPLTDSDREWIAATLDTSGARARTETVARQYTERACAALEPLPSSEFKTSMLGLAEFILVRGS